MLNCCVSFFLGGSGCFVLSWFVMILFSRLLMMVCVCEICLIFVIG